MAQPLSPYIMAAFGASLDEPSTVVDTNNTISHGYFNSTHISGAFLYYTPADLPTPWIWLLFSMLLSLLLGCIGLHSAFASWKEKPPTRFAIIRTTGSFGIVCIRSIITFIIAIRATIDSSRNHPPPSSLLLLLGSIQTYIGSRNIPLICNFLLVICQMLVYAALVLAFQNGAYGRISIGGGNCPTVADSNYAAPVYVPSCLNASRSWIDVGCQALPYKDLNDFSNKILNVEAVSGYIAGVYVLTIILALIDTISIRGEALFRPVKRDTTRRLKFAVWMGVVGLLIGAIFTPIVVSAHYSQLKRPQSLTLVDSFGNIERINRTAASARQSTTFNFGDADHWTDCFNVTKPWDSSGNGFFGEWWKTVDPVERVLAFV